MKKVLITAGPTWVKIDRVRVITSVFTGNTGMFLAKKFRERKCGVTLLMNDHVLIPKLRGVSVVPFRYFEELETGLKKLLKKNTFDLIIHTAAVSDYLVKNTRDDKMPSGRDGFSLEFTPAKKLIKTIREAAPDSLLVQFKLEVKKRGLIEKAFKSLQENKSDFAVANALEEITRGYRVYFIDKKKNIKVITSKSALFSALFDLLK